VPADYDRRLVFKRLGLAQSALAMTTEGIVQVDGMSELDGAYYGAMHSVGTPHDRVPLHVFG
jgi:hypothetical protein